MVVRFPALGDAVLLTPLLDALHARYGKKVKVLASGDWTPVLLGQHPAVGELCMVRSRRAPFWLMPSQWRAVRWLRRQRGPVYLCEADPHALRLVSRAVGPEQMVKAWEHWPGNDIHWADWWLQIAQLDPLALPGPQPRDVTGTQGQPTLALPDAWADDAAQWLKSRRLSGDSLVLVQPGHKKTHKRGRIATAHHDKHWPAERWAAVIRGILASDPALTVLVCGSPREHGLAQEIVDAAGAPLRVLNGARELPLQRLVALAACAHSMVSVDTGPAHVAAAMDCPSVVMFGQFGWGRWKPRAPRADVVALGPQAPTPGCSVMHIEVDEVLKAWRSLRPRQSQRSAA
ncbi:MAG: glycosyltransferase family 9 protein [Pseudomonadota bacterium]